MHLSTLTIEPFDLTALSSSIDKLAELWQKPIGGRDATIVAMMQDEGVNRIFTHDEGFKELEFLEVIDPIPENLDEKNKNKRGNIFSPYTFSLFKTLSF